MSNCDLVLYQQLFRFVGHPEVHNIILLASGFAFRVLSTTAGKLGLAGLFYDSHYGFCLYIRIISTGASYDDIWSRNIYQSILLSNYHDGCISNRYRKFSVIRYFYGSFRTVSFNVWYDLSFISTPSDVAIHDTYYVIVRWCGYWNIFWIILFQELMFGCTANVSSQNESDSPYLRVRSIVFLLSTLLTFVHIHLSEFCVMPCRISDYLAYVTHLNTVCSFGSTNAVLILYSLLIL